MGRGGVITHPPPLFSQIGSYNLLVKTHPTPLSSQYIHPPTFIYILWRLDIRIILEKIDIDLMECFAKRLAIHELFF